MLVAEPGSLPAQRECLEMLLEYLPQRYPQLYSLEGNGTDASSALTVHPTGERHVVGDYADCPLEMAARVVQVCTWAAYMGCLPGV